jgi:predicted Holliday junction resolvase-like endonuclease
MDANTLLSAVVVLSFIVIVLLVIVATAPGRAATQTKLKFEEWRANFPYNPRDARFLGTPIDIIVFDGADEGNIREIVFLEVKTGLSPRLTQREKQVQRIVLEKKVVWQELFIGQT